MTLKSPLAFCRTSVSSSLGRKQAGFLGHTNTAFNTFVHYCCMTTCQTSWLPPKFKPQVRVDASEVGRPRHSNHTKSISVEIRSMPGCNVGVLWFETKVRDNAVSDSFSVGMEIPTKSSSHWRIKNICTSYIRLALHLKTERCSDRADKSFATPLFHARAPAWRRESHTVKRLIS